MFNFLLVFIIIFVKDAVLMQWYSRDFYYAKSYVINLNLFIIQKDSLIFFYFSSLKPENVLIDEEGYTKLCDFGLAIQPPEHLQDCRTSIADDASSSSSVSSSSVTTKKEGSKVAKTTFFGTLEYSPPEFFLRQEYSG